MEINDVVRETVDVLKRGGIILYPTDTVWGIGCDATDPEAVAKVFALKRRDDSKSLVLLASDLDMVCRYIREIPEMAVQLVEVNDSPMTIVYPGAIVGSSGVGGMAGTAGDGASPESRDALRGFGLASNAVAADGSVGIRIPMMDFCVRLIRRFGRPIVSTSANISGEPSPKSFAEISAAVREGVDYVVDPALEAGSTGKPSSIIKLGLDSTIEIIRP